MIRYELPQNWIKYDPLAIVAELAEAKAAVLSLTTIPYQRSWAEKLQDMQLKREVAGTSRIEGADFTEGEFEAAFQETAEELVTRSQRQARAAKLTYRWIAHLPDDYPIDRELIFNVHRKIVTGADDDHCPPGVIRGQDENVNFGHPRHRGADGGDECEQAFSKLAHALQHDFRSHDILIQALALHYQFAAIHPFLDGNGRTARALEALILQRAGLRDSLFIAMSNYYYDEKTSYLATLSESRARGHDLTPFLKFGLKGIAIQCHRLLSEIKTQVLKALFRNVMFDLFNRLKSTKKRVLAERQLQILKFLLDANEIEIGSLYHQLRRDYAELKSSESAFLRDITSLEHIGAVFFRQNTNRNVWKVRINLDWPTQITETDFFRKIKDLPKAKSHPFLS